MRYAAGHYALALFEALEGKSGQARADALASFMGILKRNGDEDRLDAILRHYERIELDRRGEVKVHVETPNGASEAALREIREIIPNAVISEEANPRLLAGMRILVGDSVLIDATALRKLETLFPNTHYGTITNH